MGQSCAQMAADFGFAAQPFSPESTGDVIVDFSHPSVLPPLLTAKAPLVIGTTGFSTEQQAQIVQAARARPIFQAANFSPGVYALRQLAKAAQTLLPGWDCALIERHHRHKKDAPGGTARVIMDDLTLKPDQVSCVRAGTVRGVHEIGFYGQEEHLLLVHTAESRAAFTRGALLAAQWLCGKPNGLYGMEDMFPQ